MSHDTVRPAQPDRDARELRAQKERSEAAARPISNELWRKPELFGLYDQVTKRARWMPRQ